MKTEQVNETEDQILGEGDNPSYTPETELSKPGSRSMAPRARGLLAFALLATVIVAVVWYLHTQTYESTDDAQIDGHINTVSSRIAGNVERIYVDDNQIVQAGQPLVDLDTRELTIAEAQTGAQYAQALAQLNAEQPNIAVTRNSNEANIAMADSQLKDAKAGLEASQHDRQNAASRLTEAQATARRDQLQADRYKQLFDKDETSRQEFENYTATAQASAARLAAAEAALASADKTVEQRQTQVDSQSTHLSEVSRNAPNQLAAQEATAESQRAGVQLARAVSDRTRLDLSFTHIVAPISGVVTQRSAEPGNHIAPGEQLLMLVDVSHLWVTADFKETQLRKMHSGCRAEIHVDALGRSFEGSVESMPAITGARSSVLPPENATGNYVKVIQRLPVRIQLRAGQSDLEKLRPGMSVEARVFVK
jgi:membrane fusion protein (multidrug efflux system)